jgi:hypothetical protein
MPVSSRANSNRDAHFSTNPSREMPWRKEYAPSSIHRGPEMLCSFISRVTEAPSLHLSNSEQTPILHA